MKEKYIIYLIRSEKDNSLYIGCTIDVDKRLREHNLGMSKYTHAKKPWIIEWYCIFYDKTMAYNFEQYLKTGSGRAFINKRIRSKKDVSTEALA
ncbi:MAG: hypothetical protein A2551_04415 [Elusimicrobia bacterium RIFOXYD2_FULL_34_30]|nr:MAG: hypothetical protein A2551_04415 [Elusimicrobia bacterium RIFOXYD2_FULL_34_30]